MVSMSPLLILALAWGAVDVTNALPTTNATDKADYTGHSILSVVAATSDQVKLLFRLENEMGLDFWAEAKHPGSTAVIRVAPENLPTFAKKLSEAGMTAKTEVENVQKLIDDEKHWARFTTYSNDPFQRYLTHPEFEEALKSYGEKHDHVKYTSIGKSYEGRDIPGVHITKGTNKPIIFFECGIHAREWVAPATCLYIIDKLATLYEEDATITRLVNEYEWRIHPMVNPDGYAYSHTDDRLWRKTRSVSKLNKYCTGADANRNFDVGPFCGEGGSKKPCSEIYCGDAPFSEPESRAVRDAVMAAKGRISFYFSVHSFGLFWMFPYGYVAKNASNYEELLAIAERGAEAIRNETGTKFTVGPIEETMYTVSGSTVDWVYDKAGVTRSFVLELQPEYVPVEQTKGFLLDAKYIVPTAEETWTGIRAAIESP